MRKYNPKDYVGETMGFLTMMSDSPIKNKIGQSAYPFKCACGNIVYLRLNGVVTGHDTSCGCGLGRTQASAKRKTHGLYHHPLYKTWNNITQRCGKHKNYFNISVCEEWKSNFKSFYDWAINNGWERGLTIDRIDYNGDYKPNNCRWITQKEQTRNKSNNHRLKACGLELCVTDWVNLLGIPLHRFYTRYRNGFAEVEAMFKPPKNCKDERDFLVHQVIYLLACYKSKNGKQDLEKARHFIDLLIQLEYPE